MKNSRSFYAPIDMALLRQCSNDIVMKKKLLFYKECAHLPPPESYFSINIHLNKDFDKKHVNDLVITAGLNPHYVSYIQDEHVLSGGNVCQLKGREGYWYVATNCSECCKKKTSAYRCQCDTPNCANNIRFRRRFIHDD